MSKDAVIKPFGMNSRIWKLVFSVFAFCVVGISLVFFALSIGKPYMGIVLEKDSKGWTVQSVDPNGLAIQAGIKAGDKPVEINGQPADTFLQTYNGVGVVFETAIKELTVSDERGTLISTALKTGSPSKETQFELGSFLFVCVIFWLTGFYVFFKKPEKLASLLFCIVGLAVGLALSANMASQREIPVAPWLEAISTIVGPWLLLHFFLILPEERSGLRRNKLTYLIYLPAVITLIFFLLIGYRNGQPTPSFRTFRLFEYAIGFLAAGGVMISNYYRASNLHVRQQMKIVLISSLAALVPFLLIGILPSAIWRENILPGGSNILFIVFIPLGMGYALITKRLLDIDVIIRRTLIYGLITIIMAVILSITILFASNFRGVIGPGEQIIVVLILGGLATALLGPAKKAIEFLVDRYFYKDRYDYRQIIQSLNISLNTIKDFTGISRLAVGTTVQTLNLEGACLFIKNQSGAFELNAAQGTLIGQGNYEKLLAVISKPDSFVEFPNSAPNIGLDIAFLIPLLTGEKEIGVLCLTRKHSKQSFSADDMFLIQGIASVTAMAIQSAMLVRDVNMRDTFVSIASHELRTPLTAILGYSELLTSRDPPEATRKQWVKNILDNGKKIADMLDDLLNVTRIQSGKIIIKPEKVELDEVFQEQVAIIKEKTDKHNFTVIVDPGLPEVVVDRDKFGAVIGNLLNNAVKYSPKGGYITVSGHYDSENHRVIVSIKDEGIGISPKDGDSLFQTFHRIQRPETENIRGSGLGLYIAKEWTVAMGGEIWLESELNKGSTFFISVPTSDSPILT